MGDRHRRLDHDLQHMIKQIHAEICGHVIDQLLCHLMLHAVIIIRADGLPTVDPRQNGNAEGTGPLRSYVRIAVIVTDTGQIPVWPQACQIIIKHIRIHRVAAEDAVVMNIQFLRRSVQYHDHGKRCQAETAAIYHLCCFFRHFSGRFDHMGIDRIRISG